MRRSDSRLKQPESRPQQFVGLRQVDCAAVLGITERSFRDLVRKRVIARPAGNAGFDLREVVAAYVRYVEEGRTPGGLAEGRAALLREKAKQAKIQTQLMQGSVYPREDVEAIFRAALTIVANHLAGLGGRVCAELAPITDPRLIAAALDRETRGIRERCANELEKLGANRSRS